MGHQCSWLYLCIYSIFSLLTIFQSSYSHNHISSMPCHSCLAHCSIDPIRSKFDPAECDCLASETEVDSISNSKNSSFCYGEYCFAKLEMFLDEATAIIQKGCVLGLPPGLKGCHYYGQTESVHCYCQGELCNVREQFNNFKPNPLPSVDCCECTESKEKDEMKCPNEGCSKHCRGNYCLADLTSSEQGCGQGLPRLQSFLRTPDYLDSLQGGVLCARYQSGPETVIQGCVCTEHTGMCNELNRTRSHQLNNVVMRRLDDQNYCYSLHANNDDRPFDKSVFNRADTCEGHYCFVSLTSVELVIQSDYEERNVSAVSNLNSTVREFSPRSYYSRPKFELLAGCLKVDDDQRVSIGCTVEYTENPARPTSKHCICDSHLCNYFSLLEKTESDTAKEEEMFWDGVDGPNNGAFSSTFATQCLWRTVFFLMIFSFLTILTILANNFNV